MEELTPILTNLVLRAPVLLVWLVAIALALRSYGTHRTMALLVIVASSLLLFSEIEGCFTMILPFELEKRGYSVARIGAVFAVLGVIASLVHTVAYGLLVASIFTGRSAPEKPAERAA